MMRKTITRTDVQAAVDDLRKLADEWDALPCVCGYRIPYRDDDDSQCLSCASLVIRAILDRLEGP